MATNAKEVKKHVCNTWKKRWCPPDVSGPRCQIWPQKLNGLCQHLNDSTRGIEEDYNIHLIQKMHMNTDCFKFAERRFLVYDKFNVKINYAKVSMVW